MINAGSLGKGPGAGAALPGAAPSGDILPREACHRRLRPARRLSPRSRPAPPPVRHDVHRPAVGRPRRDRIAVDRRTARDRGGTVGADPALRGAGRSRRRDHPRAGARSAPPRHGARLATLSAGGEPVRPRGPDHRPRRGRGRGGRRRGISPHRRRPRSLRIARRFVGNAHQRARPVAGRGRHSRATLVHRIGRRPGDHLAHRRRAQRLRARRPSHLRQAHGSRPAGAVRERHRPYQPIHPVRRTGT